MIHYRSIVIGAALAVWLAAAPQSIQADEGAVRCRASIDARGPLQVTQDQHGRASLLAEQVAACCKICRKGKACGNSCISRTKTCHKGKGCACDAQ